MERVRAVRAEIGEKDSPDNFSKEYDVDIILGEASFKDKNTITVNGRDIKFLKATICTGASPNVPNIKGLNTISYMTSENVFNLTKQPKSMLIVGGGPISCELGQAFQRLGTQVSIVQRNKTILPREDTDISDILHEQMVADGVEIKLQTVPFEFKPAADSNLIDVTLQNVASGDLS